ncbi:hypothetical protein D3C85_1199550 [compost metagenome]
MPAKEGAALHLGRRGDSGNREDGRGEVDETHWRLDFRAHPGRRQVRPLGRHIDHQFTAQPFIGAIALASWHGAAVVGEVENDGVVGDTFLLQFAEPLADFGIHLRYRVVVGRQVLAQFRGIG